MAPSANAPDAALEAERKAREGAAPGHPKATYGLANIQWVQATVSDLRTVKRALLEPPGKPDAEAALGAIGSAGLVAFKILFDSARSDGDKWHIPSSGYEVVVLLAVLVNAYVASIKYVKAFKLGASLRRAWTDDLGPRSLGASTGDALRHLDEMIQQVATVSVPSQPPTTWSRLVGLAATEGVRRIVLPICVLACVIVAYAKPHTAWPVSLMTVVLVVVWEGPSFLNKIRRQAR